MSLKDLRDRLVGALTGNSAFGQREQPESNLGNGGSSGFFPNRTRPKDKSETQQQQYTQSYPNGGESNTGYYTQQFTQQQGGNGYTQQFAQQGGMGYAPQFQQQGGMSYTQRFNQQSAGYAPQFQQPAYGQQEAPYAAPPMQQGYEQGGYNAPQQGWQRPQMGYTSRQPSWQQQMPPQQQQQPEAPMDNISYMPGSFVDESGRSYVHVERVTQLVSFQACYRIIEFMKNGESVILNTESVPSEAEIVRCIDMLSGAAYTLGCSLTKITATKRAYLIAPATVQVTADVSIRRMSERRSDEGTRRRARSYADSDAPVYDQTTYDAQNDYDADVYHQQAAGQGYSSQPNGYEPRYRASESQGASFGRFGGFGGR